jgi:2-C-methyl-D-erythritol 4-phosphate cytidylyltransferase
MTKSVSGHRAGVVIPAGGSGVRFGSGTPKQYLKLKGTPVVLHTLRMFQEHPLIRAIVLVVRGEDEPRATSLIKRQHLTKVQAVVNGGEDRQASVLNGINALSPEIDVVLVHDAVRPLVEGRIIDEVIKTASAHGAAVAAGKVRDTILKEHTPFVLESTIPRDPLWAAQTPQGFSRELIVRAHRQATADGFHGTDEASLVLRLGIPVHVVESPNTNIKITTPSDLLLASAILSGRKKPSK